jgi:selenocysteine-specific elongation factor
MLGRAKAVGHSYFMRSIIVGTAGHIDHGKTSLVRALTGVDADRLPEEKRRGITIDLGFAELDLGDLRIGFVDVPGHERFVKNMLAGVHGIDAVALVIAADEGVMPQTVEHFEICRLLGVKRGLIVLTKIDAIDAELLELVRAEAESLASGSFLEGAPIVPVSSLSGEGIDLLKSTLREVGRGVAPRLSDQVARLPIDRAFTMRGFGTVVTGTLVAGEIGREDELELLPSKTQVRVRGVQVHGKAVERAGAGQRTAVNLGGVDIQDVTRGMMLAPAGLLQPSQNIDARITLLKSAPRPIRTRSRVRVHIGTSEVLARVRVLNEMNQIEPGDDGLVQLRLESPEAAVAGERFIIRSYSPAHTIAGGTVIDPLATRHRARDLNTIRGRLSGLANSPRAEQIAVFVAGSGEVGMRTAELAARTGLNRQALDAAIKDAEAEGKIARAEGIFVSTEALGRLKEEAQRELKSFHAREPLLGGMPRESLRDQIFSRSTLEVFRLALAELESEGKIASDRDLVRLSEHSLSLSEEQTKFRDALDQIYQQAGVEPPSFEDAVNQSGAVGLSAEQARRIMQLLVNQDRLVRVSNELLFHREALNLLASRLREYAANETRDRLIDVAKFKELAGVSRKYAIPLLEFLDRERITRRAGDKRLIL